MAFIHQHQIAFLEGFDGDGLLAHLVGKLVDVDDFYGLAGEQTPRILVEQLRFDACGMEFLKVLVAQAFVGRQQQNAVELIGPSSER
ncbi:MAG: hypothetical protein DDT34_01995 [Firmicutes bacterium]|nr:hypothetical protein [Bacillota bacterium]